MRKSLLTSAAALTAMIGTAHAADIYTAPPVSQAPEAYVAAAPLWTGFYVGGNVGWGKANMEGVFDGGEADTEDQVLLNWLEFDGLTGGGHVGYNFQLPSGLVLGVEGDFSVMDWSDHRLDGDIENPTDLAEAEINWIASVRGRMGAAVMERTLLYGTAGVAWVDAEYTACDCDDQSERGTVDFDEVGLVIGGGFEHKVTDAVSVRVEGLYYHFGEEKDTSELVPDESDPGDFASLEDAFIVRAGASYHF